MSADQHTLVLPEHLATALFAHLFPGDGDEHGAVIAAGIARSSRGMRLLASELFLARDGIDYVPGERGYRMLTPSFITDKLLYCRDEQLCYLAVHNHRGSDRVAFSGDDWASHERGYPALLKLARGQPVGGLVFAPNAVAGDLWLPDGGRVVLTGARVLGNSIRWLYPEPPAPPLDRAAAYDRQARIFGDAGQDLLSRLKIGVIGAGGVGSLLVEYLARLGVGHLVVVDPERLDSTNVPRVTGSTSWDARAWLQAPGRPAWVRSFGERTAVKKIDVMRRIARMANPTAKFEGIFGDFVEDGVAQRFADCDYLFLAADSFQARLVFNALVHQYLIPGVQVGSKVPVDRASGAVGNVFTVARPVRPGQGCLWCNGLIPPAKLQEEAATAAERRAQRYVEEATVHAPSVITLNATAAALAANDFLFAVTGLIQDDAPVDYYDFRPRRRELRHTSPRQDADCPECGAGAGGRLGRGNGLALPTRAFA